MTYKTSVYVIGQKGGPYKIGISVDVKSRLRSIQTGSAGKCEVLHTREASSRAYAQAIEAEAHKTLAAHRLTGEWFECELQDAIQAVDKPSPTISKIVSVGPNFDFRGQYLFSMRDLTPEQIANGARASGCPALDKEGYVEWLLARDVREAAEREEERREKRRQRQAMLANS